jgi:hypothetical protein
MTIAKNAASKLFVAMVAAAMVFTLATPAKAATAEELQAQIDALMAQISGLQGGGPATASTAACTFTRPLTIGSEGADVKCLQDAMTPTYFNHAGGSTGYFGAVTQAAVAKWQAANGVSPAAGYFGPVSQAKFASMTPAPTGDDDDDDDTATDDDDDDSTDDGELTGEASLDTFEVSDGEGADDVEEGAEDVEVAEFEIEFTDGDAEISRIDLALVVDDSNDGDDSPWDVFEDVSLWVDGDEVARMDASDEDEYLDEDDGSLRFSGLDIVAREDEAVTVVVAVTIPSSVEGSSNGEEWNVYAHSIRFIDADDVTTTDEATGDLDVDSTDPAGEFSIEEEGDGDALDLESSDEDPDATTLSLDEDDNKEYAIFAFDLSAEDSDGDIELNEISVGIQTVNSGENAVIDALVNDFRLEVGGESYSAESYTGSATTTTLVFDIDGDSVVAADEVVTAVLFADFENMDDTDNEGSTIYATVTKASIDAEGAEDITVGGADRTGNTHTLRTEGVDLGDVTDGTGSSDSTQVVSGVATDSNYGTMFLTFEITSFGDDVYVQSNNASRGASTTAAVAYTIEDSSTGSATGTGAVSVSYDIDGAEEEDGFFLLEEGETYEMTVTVNSYNPPAGQSGTYNLQILTVGFASTEVNATSTQAPEELSDYESDDVAIQS